MWPKVVLGCVVRFFPDVFEWTIFQTLSNLALPDSSVLLSTGGSLASFVSCVIFIQVEELKRMTQKLTELLRQDSKTDFPRTSIEYPTCDLTSKNVKNPTTFPTEASDIFPKNGKTFELTSKLYNCLVRLTHNLLPLGLSVYTAVLNRIHGIYSAIDVYRSPENRSSS